MTPLRAVAPLTSVLAAAAVLLACAGEAQPTAAKVVTGISPAHCVAAIEGGAAADEQRCPGFLFAAVAEARDVCSGVDGTLVGADEGSVWALDVDRDGSDEFVYEHDGNVVCEGAYSVFSCGSLGCPKVLYEKQGGAWREIAGLFFAFAPEELAALEAPPGDHADLRVGCPDSGACAEHWFYEWNGSRYERTRVDVRGFDVSLVETINGLYPLAAATDIAATPEAGAPSVGRYEAGTEVAVIGTAAAGEHYYVSPCNACESGFVPRGALIVR